MDLNDEVLKTIIFSEYMWKLAFLTPKNLESEKKRKLLLELPVQLRFKLVFRKLKVRTAEKHNLFAFTVFPLCFLCYLRSKWCVELVVLIQPSNATNISKAHHMYD